MKHFFATIIIACTMCACNKEKHSNTKTYYANNTSHKIEIIPYYQDNIDQNMYRLILPNQSYLALEKNVDGKTLEPCFGTLLQPYDSVLLVYDDTIKIPHIKFNMAYTGNHKILFNSGRSISNPQNYNSFITAEDKNSLSGYFEYIFTEQDYLDAKP